MTDTDSALRQARAGTGREWLTVGDVAAEAGVAPSAVRFYESRGVIDSIRTSGNQRRFTAAAACRIHVARLAQRVGLSIGEIADLFGSLPEVPQPADWEVVADRLLSEAEQRVRKLRSDLEALGSGARLCDLGAALGDADDREPR